MAFDETLLAPVQAKSGFDESLLSPVEEPSAGVSLIPPAADPAKRADLMSQIETLRNRKPLLQGLWNVADFAEKQTGYAAHTPAALLNAPVTIANAVAKLFGGTQVPEPFQPQKQAVTLPHAEQVNPGVVGGIATGIYNAVSDTLSGLTTPENLTALPAASSSAIMRAIFAGQIAKDVPAEAQQAIDTFNDPKATVAEKTAAVGSPIIASLMATGLTFPEASAKAGKMISEKLSTKNETPTQGALNASEIPSPAGIPQTEVRPPVGEIPPPAIPDASAQPATIATAKGGDLQPAPKNPGGAQEDLPPEKMAESKANNAPDAWAAFRASTEKAKSDTAPKTVSMTPEIKEQLKPKPDWQVTVQHTGTDIKPTVQLVDPSDPGHKGSGGNKVVATVDSVRAAGHDVPDFSKLPQGRYTYEQAVKLAKENPTIKDSLKVEPTAGSQPEAAVNPATKVESVTPLDPQSGNAIGKPVQKYRVGKSPQLHTLVREIERTPTEIENGENPVEVKNEKTGKVEIYDKSDLTPVTGDPKKDAANQNKKSSDLDKELRDAKLDPSVFSNASQKKAALKRAKAIADFPRAQLSRAPGAAASGEPNTYSAIQSLADQIEASGKESKPINERIGAIEKARVKASELKDGVKSSLANVLAIKNAMWDAYSKLSPYTEMKQIVGKWFYADNRADFEAREFGRQISKAVPDKTRREAITNWIQADGDKKLLEERAAASKGNLKRGYEIAQSLTPHEVEVAQLIREYYDRQLEKGVSEGLLKDGLENYINQVWKKENPVTRKLMNDLVNSKLQPNFKYARRRIFDSYFEGEQAGYKPVKDAGALVSNYDQSFNKALAARAFIKDLHEGVASDGRPLVEISGAKSPVDPNASKPKVVIRPKATPEEIGDYKTIDHPALRGWKWIGKTPEGNDILLQGEMKVHPEIYDKLKNRLSTSWFRQHPVPRFVLNTQNTLKQSMMSISGFHQVQENLHALGHRVNPLNLEKLDFSEPVTKSLVEHGLQLADYNALEEFGEGLSSGKLLSKIPFLGKKLQAYNDWLFQDHIPQLKLTMAKYALERNKERYAKEIESGKITPSQVLELTASQANHAFGELPLKYWGRNPNLQDFYRTFLLAPDFLEARAGFVGQALNPGGLGAKGLLKNEQLQALAVLALTQYMTARVVNQIIDNDPHWELKNAFRIIHGNHAYSLRTVPGDIIHLISDLRGFMFNRLSPIIGRGVIELATGRDYRGVKRGFFEQMIDLLKSGIPISFNHKNGQNVLETFGNAFGIQNQRYDAVQNIQQKADDWKNKNGVKTPYETIYNPDEDKFNALRTALQEGNQKEAQTQFSKLKETVPTPEIYKHFKLSLERPITGSNADDAKFYNSLDAEGKIEFKEAKDLQRARLNSVQSLK